MEFTLQDTADMLKEMRTERVQQIDALVNKMSEIDPKSLKGNVGYDEIQTKQYKMCHSLMKEVVKYESNDYPIPKTLDLHVEVLRGLEKEIRCSKDLLESLKKHLTSIQEDISYLQNKKTGLEKMKQAYLEHEELTANTTYNAEQNITRRIFRSVKTDLDTVVTILFHDNEDIKAFLADLASLYAKGGDEVYLDITPEVIDFANFLSEADIGAYHRNDTNKMRLVDMI